jgi:hypothetical protein
LQTISTVALYLIYIYANGIKRMKILIIRRKKSKNKIKNKIELYKFKIPFKLQSHGGQSKATKVTDRAPSSGNENKKEYTKS